MKIEKRRKKELGITLVALVVTIVVLLILAGITIMYVMGGNSIFKLAKDAKDKTQAGIDKEKKDIGNLVNMLKEELIADPGKDDDNQQYKITIKHMDDAGAEVASNEVKIVANGKKYTALELKKDIDGYAYDNASKDEIVINGKDETIILYYGIDLLADQNRDTNGERKGDGIPDRLQYTVSYTVNNGSSDLYAIIVTKLLNGIPSEEGTAQLEENHIPIITPNKGYTIGSWRPYVPSVGQTVTSDTTFDHICIPDTLPPDPEDGRM